jgi:hypothetical protein
MKGVIRRFLFCVPLLVCGIAATPAPSVKLVVPDSPVPYGDLIVAQAVLDSEHLPVGMVECKFKWVVIDNGQRKTVLVWPDGTKVFFPAGMISKKVTILLYPLCLYETKEGDVIKKAWVDENVEPLFATVQIGGLTPPPPPPPPPPSPVLPDGKFKLAQFTYDAMTKDSNMSQADKVKVAGALAPSFEKIAAQIAALATFRDIEKDILPALKASNTAAIEASGVPAASTVPFKTVLNNQVYSLYHDTPQKMSTADDFAVAFREIAQGLAAVK